MLTIFTKAFGCVLHENNRHLRQILHDGVQLFISDVMMFIFENSPCFSETLFLTNNLRLEP